MCIQADIYCSSWIHSGEQIHCGLWDSEYLCDSEIVKACRSFNNHLWSGITFLHGWLLVIVFGAGSGECLGEFQRKLQFKIINRYVKKCCVNRKWVAGYNYGSSAKRYATAATKLRLSCFLLNLNIFKPVFFLLTCYPFQDYNEYFRDLPVSLSDTVKITVASALPHPLAAIVICERLC